MSLPTVPAGMPAKPTVKRILSPEEWRNKQLNTLKAVGEPNYRLGISSPRKPPIQAGIDAEDKWADRIRKAIEEQRRKKGLMATNDDEWYAYAAAIGAPRLVEGVTKREKEVADFVNTWQPVLSDHVSKIDKMPAVTDKDAEERMLANLRGLKALHGAWKGR